MTKRIALVGDKNAPPRWYGTLGFRLAVLVSVTAIAVLALFWCTDYIRERAVHVQEAVARLGEEAKVLRVTRATLSDDARFQAYLDAFCHQMDLHSSPGHHIIVAAPNGGVLARAHVRNDPALEAAMLSAVSAARDRFKFNGEEFAVTALRDADSASLIVTQSLAPAYAIIRAQATSRAASLAVLTVVISLLMTAVIWRWVRRPIHALVHCTESVQRGVLSTRARLRGPPEMRFLASGFNAMIDALDRHEQARTHELERAREVQRRLLPSNSLVIPGAVVAYRYEPAEHVGGDYIDLLPYRDGRWLIAIADVSGHGIAAALLATLLKTYVHQESKVDPCPAAILTAVNQQLTAVVAVGNFVTCFLALYDPESGTLDYANAGHEPGIILRQNGQAPTLLKSTSSILGVFDSSEFPSNRTSLASGDRLVLYTDGLIECFDSGRKQYGRARLLEALTRSARAEAAAQLDAVVRDVHDFADAGQMDDDVAMLVLQHGGRDQPPTSRRAGEGALGRSTSADGLLVTHRERR